MANYESNTIQSVRKSFITLEDTNGTRWSSPTQNSSFPFPVPFLSPLTNTTTASPSIHNLGQQQGGTTNGGEVLDLAGHEGGAGLDGRKGVAAQGREWRSLGGRGGRPARV